MSDIISDDSLYVLSEGQSVSLQGLQDEVTQLKAEKVQLQHAKDSAERHAKNLQTEVDRLKAEAGMGSLSLASGAEQRTWTLQHKRSRLLTPQQMIEKSLNAKIAEVERLTEENEKLERQLRDKEKVAEMDLTSIRSDYEQVCGQNTKLQEQLKGKDRDLQMSSKNVTVLKSEFDKVVSNLTDETQLNNDLHGQLEAYEQRVEELEALLRTEQAQRVAYQKELAEASTDKHNAEDLCSEYHGRITRLNQDVTDARRQVSRMTDVNKGLQRKLEEAKEQIQLQDIQLRHYDADFNEERKQREQEAREAFELKEQVEFLREENSDLRKDVNKFSRQLQLKQEELDHLLP